jgi:hypothetical protein
MGRKRTDQSSQREHRASCAAVTDAVETLTGQIPRSVKTYAQDHLAVLKA